MKYLLPFLALLAATAASAVPQFTGTLTDEGSFTVIRLENGELLDVAGSKQRPGDKVFGTTVIDGMTYTIFDRGTVIGPIYAVPASGDS